jgi:hypothetical protein
LPSSDILSISKPCAVLKMALYKSNTSSATAVNEALQLPEQGNIQKIDSAPGQPSQAQQEQLPAHEEKKHPARIAGASYLRAHRDNESDVAEGRVKVVDFDLPLTQVEPLEHVGKEILLLKFVPGDLENPFNWSRGRKAFITVLLDLMTLFIGLATTAYSSGINSMTTELGVSIELGQLGLFAFNFACALAPLFLAPFCELVGRRTIYTGAYALFIVSFFPALKLCL